MANPIRLFVFNHLTSSLFITVYIAQKKLRTDGTRNICIVLMDEGMTGEDSLTIGCKKMARMICDEIYICPVPEHEYINMTIQNIGSDRKRKKSYLKMLKEFFEKHNIDYRQIREIFYGPRNFHQYVKYLNPGVRLIRFEHGLGDIRSLLMNQALNKRIKSIIKTAVGRAFFIFNAYAQNTDLSVSLLAPRLKRACPRLSVENLDRNSFREISSRLVQEETGVEILKGQKRSVAIVLLSHISRLTEKREDHIKMHTEFFKYIHGILDRMCPEIDTVIFKEKHMDVHYSEVKDSANMIFDRYKVIHFDEISKANLPVEIYLDFIKPKVMIGHCSSALFYAKELMPEIKSYSHHPYMSKYLTDNLGINHPDFSWLPRFFYEQYQSVFKGILPEILPI